MSTFHARLCLPLGACLLLGVAEISGASPASGDFNYHTRPRDTLIGIGRRLLIEPHRWHDVQLRNHIIDPRRLPPDSVVRIPYAWLRVAMQTATVVGVAGTVEQGGRQLAIGDVLAEGSVIETGVDGSVTLDLADGSVVTLQKSSLLSLDEMSQIAGESTANSIRLKLDAGRLETKVKPHRDVGRFEIVTPVAVSAVRGTVFRDSFTIDDAHATTETLEGSVGVGPGGDSPASVAIDAGFGTRIEKDHAPLPPVALLPPPSLAAVSAINGAASLQVPLTAVVGAKAYRVQLAHEAQFRSLLFDGLTDGLNVTIPELPDGDYWLRARSVDALGLEGTDAVRSVEQHVLPVPPSLTAPEPGATEIGTRAHFAWHGRDGGIRYALQVADDPTFAALLAERPMLDSAMADLDGLPPGRHLWRVAALNARGERGAWSAAQAYVQRPMMAVPDAPRVAGSLIEYTWHDVPGETYRVQVARDPGFAHPLMDEKVSTNRWVTRKMRPGIYYVRVQSIDAGGHAGPFSQSRRYAVYLPLWVPAAAVAIGLALLL